MENINDFIEFLGKRNKNYRKKKSNFSVAPAEIDLHKIKQGVPIVVNCVKKSNE